MPPPAQKMLHGITLAPRNGSARSASPTTTSDSTAKSQQRLDDFMAAVDNCWQGPIGYSYPVFVDYIAAGGLKGDSLGSGLKRFGEMASVFDQVAGKICEAAGGENVYLIDGKAYLEGILPREFPELTVFNVQMEDAFRGAGTQFPRLFIETQRFASLRALANMRREIRRTGISDGFKATEIVQILLGLS